MKDPGPVAQGRTLTRLAQENRQLFHRIYANAPSDLARGSRRNWALRQLSLECPDRYRQIFVEEKAALELASDEQTIDPSKVAKASGPGPWHAVLTGQTMTVCGRTRFRAYGSTAGRQVSCAYCLEEMRERRGRIADPKFSGLATIAEDWLEELDSLQERTAAARSALLDALSLLRTPPTGTDERRRLADLLLKALNTGLTLREIGARMGISGERVRQIAADANPAAGEPS